MASASEPRAVCYAAKSTADVRGSIPAQLADCHAVAAAEGRDVVADYHDEAASAYHGNRGAGLAQAMRHAEAEGCELWVQHSDRLARGDGRHSRHLVEVALWALKCDATLRSVQDPQTFGDLLYTVVTGQRNHEDSKRKSHATRAGLKRRKAAGKPVGAIPEGYKVETSVVDGRAVTSRVVDPGRARTVERIMDGLERGHTPGAVARQLNRDGLRTRQGKTWSARAVREIARNPVYTGATGYPAIITQERHRRVLAAIGRLDPVAAQARKGGRPSAEPYMLRGIVRCVRCGTALYTKRYRGERHYVCGAVREARGTCDRRPIPAERVERAVLDHLTGFVGDAREWLSAQAQKAMGERDRFAETLEAQRGELCKLRLRAERAHDQYARLLDQGDDLAPDALRAARRMEQDADHLEAAITDGDQRLVVLC